MDAPNVVYNREREKVVAARVPPNTCGLLNVIQRRHRHPLSSPALYSVRASPLFVLPRSTRMVHLVEDHICETQLGRKEVNF